MTFIKFCGMTRGEDVRAACALGADAIGFVMWSKSPRYVDARQVALLVQTMPREVTPVGVLVSPTPAEIQAAVRAGVRVIQLHGRLQSRNLCPVEMWHAHTLESDLSTIDSGGTIVLDAHDLERHGGTGRTIDWARAASVARRHRMWLAGGLTPRNVGEAIRQVRPFGVDVASGIEDRPGIKNAQAMTAFVAAVREADE